ncbi:unnamed protein product [Calypogeia fissa]
MASTALQAAASFTTASIQHPALLSDGRRPFSSSTLRGRALPLRLVRGGCKGGRNSRNSPVSTGEQCLVACSSTAIVGPLSDDVVDVNLGTKGDRVRQVDEELLACPICFRPLSRTGIPGLNQRAISRSGFKCMTCKKAYSSRFDYLDLTVTASAKVYSETKATGTELFRSPLVSFAYERGWRQNFQTAGFPGPDEEVKLAQEYLKPTYGGVLLDVSCGSGLFTRRFANLDLFAAVIAIDFSENMLRQTFEYIKEDDSLLKKSIGLVRADVARLPFATGSVDAVHAGAAVHCWPSPAAGMAEISRILRPGGVFVGTTFIARDSLGPNYIARFVRQVMENAQQSTSLRYWQEAELEDLIKLSGLVNYQRIVRQGFIMLSAQKPE